MSAFQCDGVFAPKELSIITASVSGVISIVATLGNMLIICIVIKDPLKKLHTPFNYFIVNLAISDMLVGLINQPLAVYTHALEFVRRLDNTMAKFLHLTFFVSVTSSILSLMALTIDRYVAITYPLKYRINLSWMRCFLISSAIWLFSLSVPMLYFKIGYIDYLMVFTNSGIFVTLVILVVTYVKIYKFLHKHTHELQQKMRSNSTADQEFMLKRLIIEKKVTRVYLIVMILFVATYLPAAIMANILKYCLDCDCVFQHYLRDLSLLFISMNSFMNPFVYTMRLGIFRRSLRYLYSTTNTSNDSSGTVTNIPLFPLSVN